MVLAHEDVVSRETGQSDRGKRPINLGNILATHQNAENKGYKDLQIR